MPTRPRTRIAVALALIAILALAAPTALAADRAVSIRDFAFSPRTVEIRVGDRVTWTNRDAVEHTATAPNGSFDTGPISEGESRSIRFNAAGTYRYLCTPHPNMTGTVVVRTASTGVRPPNTDSAAAVGADTEGPGTAPWAAMTLVGLVAYLVALRTIRRRHDTG